MVEPVTTANLLRLQQHAMNPASVVYPAWRDGDEAPRSQQTRRSRLREEPAVIILNR